MGSNPLTRKKIPSSPPLFPRCFSWFFLHWFPAITPVTVLIIAKTHGFPEASRAVPDPVGNDYLKVVLAVVNKLPPIAMPLPCWIDVY
jgi:hypothetical protein